MKLSFLRQLSQQQILLLTLLLIVIIGALSVGYKLRHSPASGVSITRISDTAFGDLTVNYSPLTQNAAGMSFDANTKAVTLSSGAEVSASDGTVSSGGAIASPPVALSPHYTYTGTSQTLSESHLDVFRRVTKVNSSNPLSSFLTQTGFGATNVGNDGTISQLSIKKDGYLFSVDFISGSASVYLLESTGIMTPYAASSTSLFNGTSATSPLPTAIELSIAHDFLEKYGISTEGFGTPTTENSYASVFYPLKINGFPVYEPSGSPVGMTVGVDADQKKVTTVFGIGVTSFDVSSYPAETDFQKILDLAKKGNFSYDTGGNASISKGMVIPAIAPDSGTIPPVTSVEVKLDSPTRAYLQVYSGDDAETRHTLFVPALAFPVQNQPDNYYGGSKIVIPLVTLK